DAGRDGRSQHVQGVGLGRPVGPAEEVVTGELHGTVADPIHPPRADRVRPAEAPSIIVHTAFLSTVRSRRLRPGAGFGGLRDRGGGGVGQRHDRWCHGPYVGTTAPLIEAAASLTRKAM